MVLFYSMFVWVGLLFSPHTVPHTEKEIIYARRDGMALTMTVLIPKKPNGKAIVSLLSGGYYSDHSLYPVYRDRALPFVESGYTVFLTSHSSTPRYSIADALEDVQKAIQFVRSYASEYAVDPNNIGITGTSSGGHLALLAATTNDIKNENSKDPIERQSSRVQAAAVFCPPTDFLNYGSANDKIRNKQQRLKDLQVAGSFRYKQFNENDFDYVLVDEKRMAVMDSLLSPAQNVTPDDPPIYISHGTKDDVVPIQQSETMAEKLKAAKVPVVVFKKEGAGHGWKNMNADETEFVAWFNKYLGVSETPTSKK